MRGVTVGVWHAHVLVEIRDVDCEEQLVLALGPLAVGNLGHLHEAKVRKFAGPPRQSAERSPGG